jgi:muramoyltetrapeptide carboxypeptidase
MKIAAFSPSSPPDSAKVQGGIELLRRLLSTASITCFSKDEATAPFSYLAQEDTEQAQLFQHLMTTDEIDLVWAMRGGYGSLRWLTHVDWHALAHAPRKNPLLGFSDVTFLHSALLNLHWPVLIHGPLLTTLIKTDTPSIEAVKRLLIHHEPPSLLGQPLLAGTARGHLIGGNLTCLLHTLGTTFEPPWDQAILVIEDHNEALYRIDRMLTHLRLADRLSRLAGIAVGEILHTGIDEQQLKALLLDRLQDLDIPVIWNLPVGHGTRNMPFILGMKYEIQGETGELRPYSRISIELPPAGP